MPPEKRLRRVAARGCLSHGETSRASGDVDVARSFPLSILRSDAMATWAAGRPGPAGPELPCQRSTNRESEAGLLVSGLAPVKCGIRFPSHPLTQNHRLHVPTIGMGTLCSVYCNGIIPRLATLRGDLKKRIYIYMTP